MKLTLFTRILCLSVLISLARTGPAQTTDSARVSGPFALPALPYALNALEPVISEQTMSLHYNKHLQGYIDNLNRLIQGTPFENADIVYIVKNSDGPVFNNGAQYWNHVFYFNTFSPQGKKEPEGALGNAIKRQWGSFDNFRQAFSNAGNGIFGSGWVWLVQTPDGSLKIVPKGNAGNPLTDDDTPLLGIDVWEHAYYLDYQNRRTDHLNHIWEIIDWNVVEDRYDPELAE